MAEDKINRFVMKRELRATSKQRRLYRMLKGSGESNGETRGMSRGELADLIANFPADKIAEARDAIRGMKRATKYQRAMAEELGVEQVEGLIRATAKTLLDNIKKQRPDDYSRAKAKLRGFTYAEE